VRVVALHKQCECEMAVTECLYCSVQLGTARQVRASVGDEVTDARRGVEDTLRKTCSTICARPQAVNNVHSLTAVYCTAWTEVY